MKHFTLLPVFFLTLGTLSSTPSFAQVRNQWTAEQMNTSIKRNCHNDKVECSLGLARDLADELYYTVDYERYGRVFLPIMIKAALAEDTLEDYGPYALDTREVILDFVRTVKKSEKEIHSLLTPPSQFNIARSLLSVVRVLEKEIR